MINNYFKKYLNKNFSKRVMTNSGFTYTQMAKHKPSIMLKIMLLFQALHCVSLSQDSLILMIKKEQKKSDHKDVASLNFQYNKLDEFTDDNVKTIIELCPKLKKIENGPQ